MRLSQEQFASHPGLLAAVRHLAKLLRRRFNDNPRIARLLSAHQKWLLTQIGMALNLEESRHGFTVSQLREFVTPNNIASRNTVQNYLDQLEIYRFVEKVGHAATRPRRYRATLISEQAMFDWYVANLSAIDGMDGGTRAATLMASPDIFRLAQPWAARACLGDPDWIEPPKRAGLFLWTEAGALVLDEFVTRIEDAENGAGEGAAERIDIGHVDARALAAEFMMSRTHLQRLLNRAADDGSMGWTDATPRASMWISRDFLEEYCRWQAIKFSHVNDAFIEALAQHGEDALANGSSRAG